MRVFPNNDGSELVFTLYRRPDVSDQEFAEDAKSVEKDLAKLKTLLATAFREIFQDQSDMADGSTPSVEKMFC